MKLNNKILISWILVILWMITIFYLSSMNSEVSNTKSKDTINTVVTTAIETTNNIGITNKDISQDKVNSLVNILNISLRKCMHSLVYFVLVILLINAFYNTNIRNYKAYLFSIVISFIYACTDEYHQLFVLGRTGQFIDVLIDTIGALLGCLVFYGVSKWWSKRRNESYD